MEKITDNYKKECKDLIEKHLLCSEISDNVYSSSVLISDIFCVDLKFACFELVAILNDPLFKVGRLTKYGFFTTNEEIAEYKKELKKLSLNDAQLLILELVNKWLNL